MKEVIVPATASITVSVNLINVLDSLQKDFLGEYGWIEKKGNKYFLMEATLSHLMDNPDSKGDVIREITKKEVDYINAIETVKKFLTKRKGD